MYEVKLNMYANVGGGVEITETVEKHAERREDED